MMLPDKGTLCPYRNQHTWGGSRYPWTLGGPQEQTEIIKHRRGIQVVRRCLNCNTRSGAIPMQAVWEWIDRLGTPVIRYGNLASYPPCSYTECTAPGVDLHHFAPSNTFGPDADNWPVMPLCGEHHREWHRRMSGYQWNAKAAA